MVLLVGCGSEPSSTERPGPGVEILEAWSPVAAVGATGAVFMKIVNRETVPERLMAVDSRLASDVVMVGGTGGTGKATSPLPGGFGIAAGATLELAPGHSHFVLNGLSKGLTEGETYLLRLHFKNAGTMEVAVTVRAE